MTRVAKILALTAALAASASMAAAADPWIRAESEHFVVYSNSDAKITSDFVLSLEQYRYVLSSFYGVAGTDEALPRFSLYFVNDMLNLKQVWPGVTPEVLGFYTGCAEGQAAVSLYLDDKIHVAKKVEDQPENFSRTVLFHEYAHSFMFQYSTTAYPPWFVEGFAEYYGTTRVQDKEALIGMAWQDRVDTLLQPGWGITYDKLLSDPPGLHSLPSLAEAYYAQSWLLTHWIFADVNRRAQFRTYLTAYGNGDNPVTAFETAFGIKVKDLDKTLHSYLYHMKAQAYQMDAMPTPHVTISAMPASAQKLLLPDAGVRMCAAGKGGQSLLDTIRTEAAGFPNDNYAQTVLARAEIVVGDEAKALPWLKASVAAHPKDAEKLALLGETWYLMTNHKQVLAGETAGSQLQHARDAMGAAYQFDPLNATNLFYFSLALDNTSEAPDENAVNAAVEAHDLAPSVFAYASHAAMLLIRSDRLKEAASMLYPMASNPHAPELAARMRGVIDAIDKGASKAEILAMLAAKPGDGDDDGTDGGGKKKNP